MSTLTIHSLDPQVEKKVRQKARRENKSLNRVLKELLEERYGQSCAQTKKRSSEFKEFLGIWSTEDEQEFTRATAEFERIDDEDWR